MLKYSKKKNKLEIPCGLGNVNCMDDSSIRYQEKTLDSSTIAQVVTYDQGYNALSTVTVNPYTLEQQAALIENNGHFVFRPINEDAISSVEVDVSISGPVEQEKNLSLTENGTYTLTPDPGYTGISKAILDVSVETGITPEGNFTLNDLETHDVSAYATANVSPVGIIPGNIRKDVEILGVTGTFEGGELIEETVDSSTVSQTVTPSEGYYGLSSVTVNPYTLETKSDLITENGSYTYTPDEANALSSVSIDVNVQGEEINNQSKTVNSSTSSQEVTYDLGYTGLEKVTVNPYTLESKSDSITENGSYTYTPQSADGLDSVTVDVSVDTVNNQSKTVNSSTSSQTVTPDAGYTGLDSVTVNPYSLDSKTVNSSTNAQTVTSSVDGLLSVTVNPYTLESKSDSITENGTYTYTPDEANALSSVSIDVNVPGEEINNQSKTVNSSTSSQEITYDSGYTGLEKVTVNPYTLESKSDSITANGSYTYTPQSADGLDSVTVDVSIDTVNNQNKTVNSSTSSQEITYDSGYTGLEKVTVNPYTLETKSDSITANGTYTYTPQSADGLDSVTVDVSIDTVNNQNKTINSSTSSQTVTPDAGYTGLDSVTVNPYSLDSKTVNSSTNAQTVTSSADGLSQVTVNPYTVESKSDSITANGSYTYTPDNANALSSVSIDVNVPGEEINNQTKTVDSSSVSQTVTYDSGYTGLETVTVNPYNLETLTPGTATEEEIFIGETAWVNGEQLTGEFDYPLVNSDIDDILGQSVIQYQAKTADASTESQVISADAGYLGLSQVTVNPYSLEEKTDSVTENGTYTYTPDDAEGLGSVTVTVNVPGEEINNQTKTVNSSTSSQTVTYDSGYTGLESVTVNPYSLDSKTVNSSTNAQTVTSSADGLSQVTVNPYTLESKSDSITANGSYTYTPQSADGLNSVTVDVSVDTVNNQSKTVNSSTSSQEITYDSGYTGLEKVTVNPYTVESKSDSITVNGSYTYTPDNANALSSVTVSVNVPGEEINNQSKTVDSSSVSQTVTYDAGYTGLEYVTVNPYSLETLTPGTATEEEIFLGKTAWVDGEQLTGEFDYDLVDDDIDDLLGDSELLYQTKTVDSSTASQTVRPDAGYLGLTQVTVNPYSLDSKTVNSSTNAQTVTSSVNGLSQVTVNPYTLESKSDSITANGSYTYTATSADGLSSVTIGVSVEPDYDTIYEELILI